MRGRPRVTSQLHPSPTHHEPLKRDSSALPHPRLRKPPSPSCCGHLEHTSLQRSTEPHPSLLPNASHPTFSRHLRRQWELISAVTVACTVTGPASSAAPTNSRDNGPAHCIHLVPTSTPVAPSVSTPFCVVSARATLRCASAGSGTVRRWDSLRRMRSDLSWHSRVRSSPVRTQRLGWSLLHLRYQVQ